MGWPHAKPSCQACFPRSFKLPAQLDLFVLVFVNYKINSRAIDYSFKTLNLYFVRKTK